MPTRKTRCRMQACSQSKRTKKRTINWGERRSVQTEKVTASGLREDVLVERENRDRVWRERGSLCNDAIECRPAQDGRQQFSSKDGL